MFCGSVLENMHHRPVPYVSAAIGLGVLAVFVHAVRTRYDRRNAFFFYAAVWILLTGLVVANARTALGMELSLSSRYKIYCDLLLVFCYEYLLDRVGVRRQTVPQGLKPQDMGDSSEPRPCERAQTAGLKLWACEDAGGWWRRLWGRRWCLWRATLQGRSC
jgi:hypothetical protein